MPRFCHPEALAGEVWLGNLYPCDFPAIGWVTRRLGENIYDSDGKKLTGSQRPAFVQLAEIESGGVTVPDRGPIDHRWNGLTP